MDQLSTDIDEVNIAYTNSRIYIRNISPLSTLFDYLFVDDS